ncbi:heterokaryon incompatibility protein-domain-containing protein [Podospora didyma]|uniref:Heterokaryon incompatibility protein-domain-containing protein n=1 Tax=Podospora didyma TaxID=330526 RepID=A0AAE0KEW1_9PEZI|nr:heterokaryon incompatibility protein-domain-containing protein [Podospora didyma]
MEDGGGLCSSGLWDDWDKKGGVSIPVSHVRECSSTSTRTEKSCAPCRMLLGIVDHLRPGWTTTTAVAAGQDNNNNNNNKTRAIAIRRRERWLFNSNMKLLGGTEAIRLVEGGKDVGELFQLYQAVTDDEKLRALDDEPDPWEKVLLGETVEIAPASDSDLAFTRASRWLSHCVDSHESCRHPAAAAPGKGSDSSSESRPRRLLRINQSPVVASAYSVGERSINSVTLIESLSVSPELPYVALSYCWGPPVLGMKIVTTVRSNLEAHQQRGIPLSELPQTVQDAIVVSARLGVTYIWVDALCIVQDDADDWAREAAKMVDVYANSHLTISAKQPDSCHKGFLGPQKYGDPGWQRPIEDVELPSSVSGRPGEAGGGRKILVRKGQVDNTDSFTRHFPLDTRGWCLQESVLPRRRLVYDGCEMSWSCLERVLCECGHMDEVLSTAAAAEGNDDDDQNYDFSEERLKAVADRQMTNILRHGNEARMKNVALSNFHYHWNDIARQYSQRFLTQSSDKLVAISGLAKTFQRGMPRDTEFEKMTLAAVTQNLGPIFVPAPPTVVAVTGGGSEDYFAGMWKCSLLSSLTWAVDHHSLDKTGRERHARYPAYCAPTWSWASIDGPVMFGMLELSNPKWEAQDEVVCDALPRQVSCTPSNAANVHGALQPGAYMVITGPVARVELAVLNMADDYSNTGSASWDNFLRRGAHGNPRPRPRMPCLVRTEVLSSSYRVLLDVPQPLTFDQGDRQQQCWFEGQCQCWESKRAQKKENRRQESSHQCVFDQRTEYVCLRLLTYREKDRFDPLGMKEVVLFLVLKKVSSGDGGGGGGLDTYERIGMGTWTEMFAALGPMKLFDNADERTIKII